eukprot:282354-Pelagomonas_calceolata.AAC.2
MSGVGRCPVQPGLWLPLLGGWQWCEAAAELGGGRGQDGWAWGAKGSPGLLTNPCCQVLHVHVHVCVCEYVSEMTSSMQPRQGMRAPDTSQNKEQQSKFTSPANIAGCYMLAPTAVCGSLSHALEPPLLTCHTSRATTSSNLQPHDLTCKGALRPFLLHAPSI